MPTEEEKKLWMHVFENAIRKGAATSTAVTEADEALVAVKARFGKSADAPAKDV